MLVRREPGGDRSPRGEGEGRENGLDVLGLFGMRKRNYFKGNYLCIVFPPPCFDSIIDERLDVWQVVVSHPLLIVPAETVHKNYGQLGL